MFDGSSVDDIFIFPNLPLFPILLFYCYKFIFTTVVKLKQSSHQIIWNDENTILIEKNNLGEGLNSYMSSFSK